MEGLELSIWINKLISKNELWRFYKSKPWLKLKAEVLRKNHYECAICKAKGIITRFDIGADGSKRKLSTVHHIKHVRDYPELALSKDNLIPVCKACHNKLHPEKIKKKNIYQSFTNTERW